MLSAGNIYHIYNRTNGSENLFREEKNYFFFLRRMNEHITPVAEIFAWCLLANHFHLMIRIRKEEEVQNHLGTEAFQKFETFGKLCSKRFSNFFSSYTQAYNKVYKRTGSLFQPNMKQKQVTNQRYFTQLILYIHSNAVKHGFVQDINDWPHSSWWQYIAPDEHLPLQGVVQPLISLSVKEEVFRWFGNKEAFIDIHQLPFKGSSSFE